MHFMVFSFNDSLQTNGILFRLQPKEADMLYDSVKRFYSLLGRLFVRFPNLILLLVCPYRATDINEPKFWRKINFLFILVVCM